MPERGFDTSIWNADSWFQKLSRDQRYLFIYLWTNDHCTPAGLYQITLTTISNETRFLEEELPDILHSLSDHVEWYSQEDLIWVRNFIKKQSKSPKFLQAAAKSLLSISNNGAVKEMLEYNLLRYSISIPYQYYIDRVSILTRDTASVSSASADPVSGGVGVVKGKGGTADIKEIIVRLGQLKGWQADEDDVLWLQGLRSESPGFTLADFRACVDYYSGKPPPKQKGIWKNRFRNWMLKKKQFQLEQGSGKGKLPTTEELEREWKGKK